MDFIWPNKVFNNFKTVYPGFLEIDVRPISRPHKVINVKAAPMSIFEKEMGKIMN